MYIFLRKITLIGGRECIKNASYVRVLVVNAAWTYNNVYSISIYLTRFLDIGP